MTRAAAAETWGAAIEVPMKPVMPNRGPLLLATLVTW
jgi:hypothetical protein